MKVLDGNGKRYNVEMQVAYEKSYIKRIIYYLDKLYTSQLKESEPYETLNKSISISILNFILLKNEPDIHNIYKFLNIKSGNELTDLKEIHFIELPKFIKMEPEELETTFEKWLYTLKYGEKYVYDIDDIPYILKEEEEIVMALNEMLRASDDDQLRELIEMRQKARHDEASRMYNATIEAQAQGMSQGIAQGMAQGMIQGLAEGKLEAEKEILLKLLNKKFKEIPDKLVYKIKSLNNINLISQIINSIFDIQLIDDVFEIIKDFKE